jgi:hypothetical protein
VTDDLRLQESAQVAARPAVVVAVGSEAALAAVVVGAASADVREDLPRVRALAAGPPVEGVVLRSAGPEGAAGTPKSWSRAN